jgi:vancomycin resistance protein YoaR
MNQNSRSGGTQNGRGMRSSGRNSGSRQGGSRGGSRQGSSRGDSRQNSSRKDSRRSSTRSSRRTDSNRRIWMTVIPAAGILAAAILAAIFILKSVPADGAGDAASAGVSGAAVTASSAAETADPAADTAVTGADAADTAVSDAAAQAQTAGSAASAADVVEETGYTQKDRVILKGLTIGGVDVSGLTEEQAEAKVEESLSDKKQTAITLKGKEDSQQVSVTAGDLGLRWANKGVLDEAGRYGHGSNIIARYKDEKDLTDHGADFAVTLTFDKNAIRAALENQCASFNQDAVNATLTRNGGAFSIVDGKTGYTINEDSSTEKIYSYLTTAWDGQAASVDLDIDTQEPLGSQEELAKVTDVLGTFTTSYASSGENRCENIANGCRLVNGHTVYPGETFSVLESITPFTAENGYALAGSYLGSQVVDSFGGGICQVSTTLYNAVIRSELDIVERYNHSLIVGYVKPSMDAAIAESSGMDFKFKNNLKDPIYIEGYTSGKSITFNIYGVETRDPGRQVSFESEVLETIEPEGEAVYTDSTQPVGSISYTAAHTGYKAQLWKIVTQDGKQVSKEVFNKSTYNAAPKSCTVGTAGTVSAELQAAIDSQSIEAVEAAVNGTTPAAGTDTGTAGDALTAAAQAAAQQAYAAALAQGQDQATAMAAAQAAAQAVVAAGTGQ